MNRTSVENILAAGVLLAACEFLNKETTDSVRVLFVKGKDHRFPLVARKGNQILDDYLNSYEYLAVVDGNDLYVIPTLDIRNYGYRKMLTCRRTTIDGFPTNWFYAGTLSDFPIIRQTVCTILNSKYGKSNDCPNDDELELVARLSTENDNYLDDTLNDLSSRRDYLDTDNVQED